MLKFALNAELAKLKLTYITVVKKPKLGHSRHFAQSSLPSRSSGPWLNRLTLALISLLSEAPKKDREKKMLEHYNTSSKREKEKSAFFF